MNEQLSEVDNQIRETPRVHLVIAIALNETRRNACLFFALVAAALVFFFSWSNWLFLIPSLLGIGAFLHQMNIVLLSSEMKRRSKEPPEKPEEN